MVHCAAYNCLTDSRKNKLTSLYKFPSKLDSKRRNKWLTNLRLKDFKIKKHSRLCQLHFEFKCFERSPELLKSLGLDVLGYRPKLNEDAVPTLFDRGSPKAKCQMRGKQTFSTRKQDKAKEKYKGRLSPRLSPRKRFSHGKKYGAFAKRRRLEVSLYLCYCSNLFLKAQIQCFSSNNSWKDFVGLSCRPKLQDDVIAWWQIFYCNVWANVCENLFDLSYKKLDSRYNINK